MENTFVYDFDHANNVQVCGVLGQHILLVSFEDGIREMFLTYYGYSIIEIKVELAVRWNTIQETFLSYIQYLFERMKTASLETISTGVLDKNKERFLISKYKAWK